MNVNRASQVILEARNIDTKQLSHYCKRFVGSVPTALNTGKILAREIHTVHDNGELELGFYVEDEKSGDYSSVYITYSNPLMDEDSPKVTDFRVL